MTITFQHCGQLRGKATISGAKRLSFQATHPPQLPEDLVAGINRVHQT